MIPPLPAEAAPRLLALSPAFTRPTWHRFTLLMTAAILTTGRRTGANLLRTTGPSAQGHKTSFQRVPSAAPLVRLTPRRPTDAARRRFRRRTVAWYGGGSRQV